MKTKHLAKAAALAALCGAGLVLSGATCGTTPATSAQVQPVRAVLGPGDVVEIRVFGEPELSAVYQVGAEGSVRLPLVGDVGVQGLTVDDATAKIEAAYNDRYLRNAQVSVFVKEFNSLKVYVLGQVAKPGPLPYQSRMTIIDAIAKAGGTTKIADADRTIITREQDGAQRRLTAQVASIGKGTAPDVELMPGDIVFVPETLF